MQSNDILEFNLKLTLGELVLNNLKMKAELDATKAELDSIKENGKDTSEPTPDQG